MLEEGEKEKESSLEKWRVWGGRGGQNIVLLRLADEERWEDVRKGGWRKEKEVHRNICAP